MYDYGSQDKTATTASNGVIPSAAERKGSGVEGSESQGGRNLLFRGKEGPGAMERSDLSAPVRLWLTFGRDDSACLCFFVSV